jgi:hypothetical protein
MGSWLRRVAREAAVVGLFLALAAWATRPLVLDLAGTTLIGPDPARHLWATSWAASHLFRQGFFDGNIFYPFGHGLLYADFSLGSVVLVAPLRPLVRDPVPLFNLATLLALAFSGWTFHLLVRSLTGRLSAGLLTGILAGFASHQLYHVYHLNLLSTGWIPLLLLGLHRLAERPGWPAALLAAVSFSLTAQSSGYYAVIATLLAVLFAAAHPRALSRRACLLWSLAAALGALALTWPYLAAYAELRRLVGLSRAERLSVDLAFQPLRDLGSHGYLWGSILGHGGERMFPGLLAPVLAAVAVVRRVRHAAFYVASALLLAVLALGPELEVAGRRVWLPYRLLFALPPLDSMRHPYTFAAVATFALAVLAGLGWASLGVARRPWAGALVVLLAIVEIAAPGPRVRQVPPGLPPIYRLLSKLPPGPVLEIPVFSTDALLWAARDPGLAMVNGGGAFGPPYTYVLDRTLKNHWLEGTPEDVDGSKPARVLREIFPGVRYLVLPTERRPALWSLAAALDRSRGFGLVGEAPGGDRLYRVRTPPDQTRAAAAR